MEGQIQKHWKFRPEPEFFAPPGPLAEHLAPEIALTGLRAHMTRRKPAGLFNSAWSHIEYALNQQNDALDNNMRQKYLGDASYLFGRIIAQPGNRNKSELTEDLFLNVLTANSYLPLLAKRATHQPVTPRDCSDVYQSLGVAIREQRRFIPDSSNSWRAAETVTFAASARTMQPGLLLWPASPREEGSGEQQSNHDNYFISDDMKIPIQLKLIETDKQYSEPIITIYLLPILDHASKRAGLSDNLNFGQSLEFATDAIIAETTGQLLSRQQQSFLDYFSRSVVARCRYADTQAAA